MISIINVVAGAIIVGSRLFVARRSAALSSGGLWELPGGKVEESETDHAALIRELKEELGVEVVVQELLGTSDVTIGDRKILMRVYRCIFIEPFIFEPRVHSEFIWADSATIHQLSWAPADIPLLPDLCILLNKEA